MFERLVGRLAAVLIAVGATPNSLTMLGVVLTTVCGICLAIGGGDAPPWDRAPHDAPVSFWPLVAAIHFTGACLCDLLDGPVARIGKLSTPFGALLDSTLDRVSDLILALGCATFFAGSGNVTYVVLSVIMGGNAVLISYIKARAENVIDRCSVGFWQRGERCVLLLIGLFCGHVAVVLWVLATLPVFTVARRLLHSRRRLCEKSVGRGCVSGLSVSDSRFFYRGSSGYVACAAALALFVLLGPYAWPFLYGRTDPIGAALRGLWP